MARNYKRLGGIINASAGPAKARAVFAESFGILRKNVVNLRKNPVSSPWDEDQIDPLQYGRRARVQPEEDTDDSEMLCSLAAEYVSTSWRISLSRRPQILSC